MDYKRKEDLIRILSAQHTEAAERMRFRRTVRNRMVARLCGLGLDIGVDGVRHSVTYGGVVVAYKLDVRMDWLVQQMFD